jgi:RimJ/RimL family protein N-acetyltransferase
VIILRLIAYWTRENRKRFAGWHTDARNQRSRAAIERMGGKFEGILRSHRMAADFIARDSARFSIVAAEWPDAKRRLSEKLK